MKGRRCDQAPEQFVPQFVQGPEVLIYYSESDIAA
jgi:hypothetical protein